MNNVIKEFDVLMKKMRNLGFGLAANDLELAHKKALADQLNQVREIVEQPEKAKFPRGKRKWCVECAKRIRRVQIKEINKLK